MALDIAREIATLRKLTVGQLRAKYQELLGRPTSTGNKGFLFKRIVWHLQAAVEGGLSEQARRRAAEIACDADIRMTALKANSGAEHRPAATPRNDRRPMPGTVLRRMYRGRVCQVTVLPGGFEYDGRVYRTLTAVAKAITGAHWNGPLFFKLARAPREGVPA